jgi:hypothetical protein
MHFRVSGCAADLPVVFQSGDEIRFTLGDAIR